MFQRKNVFGALAALAVNARLYFNGPGGSVYITFDGVNNNHYGANFIVNGGAVIASGIQAGAGYSFYGWSSEATYVRGTMVDGAAAIAVKLGSGTAYSTAGAKLVTITNNNVEKAFVGKDGDFVNTGTGGFGLGGNTGASQGLSNSGANTVLRAGGDAFTVEIGSPSGMVFAKATQTGLDLSANNNAKIKFAATDSSGTPGAATINKPSGQVAVASGASSVVVTNSLVSSTSVVLCVLQDATDALYIRSVVPGAGTFTITLSGVTTGARKVGFVVIN